MMAMPETAEPGDNPDATDEASNTASLPASLVGDCQPGDSITLRVVSVDGDTVTVEKDEAGGAGGGSEEMAKEFDHPGMRSDSQTG